MKVLFCGDSPTVSTGFARCTRAACDALYAAGHEVIVLGINESGDPRPSDIPYPIYPCFAPYDSGRDAFGVTRLPRLLVRHRPDLIVLLNDPWNVKGYFDYLRKSLDESIPIPPVIGWLAVDSVNQEAGKQCNDLSHLVVWTEFGAQELIKGGYEGGVSVVGLGVDHSIFQPQDQAECRRKILDKVNIPSTSFIIGVVGRNQIRKRLDLTIQYFAQWIHSRDIQDAYLLMHVAPTGDVGTDLLSLANYYRISDRVLVRTPHVGHGVKDHELATLYGSMDLLITTSQAEGWSLNISEAMACGIPCIVPNYAALGPLGWTRNAAVQVACTSNALTAPMNGLAYTIGGIPDRATFVEELHAMYTSPKNRQAYRQRGLRRAATLSWERCGQEFLAAVESTMSRLNDKSIINSIHVEAASCPAV